MLKRRGVFISFEGPDGAGKTSQVEHLIRRLDFSRLAYVKTHEPGGTVIGSELRAMLLHTDRAPLTPEAEALLLSADRAQHVAEVIRPGLAAGEIVVSDRFSDSTFAHQGAGLGLDRTFLDALTEFVTGGLKPDLTILLDLDVAVGLARRRAAFGRMEGEYNRIDRRELSYHQRVRDEFRRIAEAEPDRVTVVDADRPFDDVAEEIWQRVSAVIRRLGRVGNS